MAILFLVNSHFTYFSLSLNWPFWENIHSSLFLHIRPVLNSKSNYPVRRIPWLRLLGHTEDVYSYQPLFVHLPWARSLEILWQGPGIAHQRSLVQQVRAFYNRLLWKAGSGYTPCRNLTLFSLFVWVEFTLLSTFVRPWPNPISKRTLLSGS